MIRKAENDFTSLRDTKKTDQQQSNRCSAWCIYLPLNFPKLSISRLILALRLWRSILKVLIVLTLLVTISSVQKCNVQFLKCSEGFYCPKRTNFFGHRCDISTFLTVHHEKPKIGLILFPWAAPTRVWTGLYERVSREGSGKCLLQSLTLTCLAQGGIRDRSHMERVSWEEISCAMFAGSH